MEAFLGHKNVFDFFDGDGYEFYELTSPFAQLRGDACMLCFDKLRSDEPAGNEILLTHAGSCMQTFHGVCLLTALVHKPTRCPYYPHAVDDKYPNNADREQFGIFILSDPRRTTFNDQSELLTAIQEQNHTINAVLQMWDAEDKVIEHLEAIGFELYSDEDRIQKQAERTEKRRGWQDKQNRNNVLIANAQSGINAAREWPLRGQIFDLTQRMFDEGCKYSYDRIAGFCLKMARFGGDGRSGSRSSQGSQGGQGSQGSRSSQGSQDSVNTININPNIVAGNDTEGE